MKNLRHLALVVSAAALISAGFNGCASDAASRSQQADALQGTTAAVAPLLPPPWGYIVAGVGGVIADALRRKVQPAALRIVVGGTAGARNQPFTPDHPANFNETNASG